MSEKQIRNNIIWGVVGLAIFVCTILFSSNSWLSFGGGLLGGVLLSVTLLNFLTEFLKRRKAKTQPPLDEESTL